MTVATIGFSVNDVKLATNPLAEIPAYQGLARLLGEAPSGLHDFDNLSPEMQVELAERVGEGIQKMRERLLQSGKVESCSDYSGKVVSGVDYHPLFAAAYKSFHDHRPLTLSPDIIWLTVVQGLAKHINLNAEDLRSKFVQHQGNVKITVRRDDFVKGTPENPWPEVFSSFNDAIKSHIGESHSLITAQFSTTGIVEQAAFDVSLMDAMQSYFKYEVMTLCGIPSITLEGTVADWELLREKVIGLRGIIPSWWGEILKPICDQFVAAAEGIVDSS